MKISKDILFIVLSIFLLVSVGLVQNADSEEPGAGLLGRMLRNNVERSVETLGDTNALETAKTTASTVRKADGSPEDVACFIDPVDGSLARISVGSYFGTSFSLHGFWDIPSGLPNCNGFAFIPIHGTAVLSSNLRNVSMAFAATCVDENWAGGHFHFDLDLVTGVGTGYTINNETGEKFTGSLLLTTCPF
jgi:hypothetical protein